MRYLVDLKPKELEEKFQIAINNWENAEEENKKIYWDEMFLLVANCCRALCLKMAPGKSLVEERSLDGAIKVMDRIQRLKKHPNKLSSYCYWPAKEAIQGPKVVHEDLESHFDDKYEEQTEFEEIRGICRKELMNTYD